MVREVSPTLSELCGKSSSSGSGASLAPSGFGPGEKDTPYLALTSNSVFVHTPTMTRIISLLYLLLWSVCIIPISTLRIPQTLNLHPSRKESPPSQSKSPNLPHSLPLPRRTRRRTTEGALGSVRLRRGRECGTGRYVRGSEGRDLAKAGRGKGSQGTEGADRCCHQGGGEAEEEIETG
jgi:hypothetical protein